MPILLCFLWMPSSLPLDQTPAPTQQISTQEHSIFQERAHTQSSQNIPPQPLWASVLGECPRLFSVFYS